MILYTSWKLEKTDAFQDEVLAKIEIYYCVDTTEKAYDEKSQVFLEFNDFLDQLFFRTLSPLFIIILDVSVNNNHRYTTKTQCRLDTKLMISDDGRTCTYQTSTHCLIPFFSRNSYLEHLERVSKLCPAVFLQITAFYTQCAIEGGGGCN